MKQTETTQTAPTSTSHQDGSPGKDAPVRKRQRRRRLTGW